jgi:hypothetical protein
MHSLRFTAQTSSNGVVERDFTLGEITGVIWSPASGSEHAPLVLMGHGGGITLGTAIGIPLAAIEPRITAAIFGGGFFVHEALIEAARRITVPVQFLLPWDDEHVDRQSALALFDAFASEEKTLHANPGDHRTIRWFGVDDEFLARHLGHRLE